MRRSGLGSTTPKVSSGELMMLILDSETEDSASEPYTPQRHNSGMRRSERVGASTEESKDPRRNDLELVEVPKVDGTTDIGPVIGPGNPSGDGLTVARWHLCEDDSTPTGHWVRGTTADTTVFAPAEQQTPLNKKALRALDKATRRATKLQAKEDKRNRKSKKERDREQAKEDVSALRQPIRAVVADHIHADFPHHPDDVGDMDGAARMGVVMATSGHPERVLHISSAGQHADFPHAEEHHAISLGATYPSHPLNGNPSNMYVAPADILPVEVMRKSHGHVVEPPSHESHSRATMVAVCTEGGASEIIDSRRTENMIRDDVNGESPTDVATPMRTVAVTDLDSSGSSASSATASAGAATAPLQLPSSRGYVDNDSERGDTPEDNRVTSSAKRRSDAVSAAAAAATARAIAQKRLGRHSASLVAPQGRPKLGSDAGPIDPSQHVVQPRSSDTRVPKSNEGQMSSRTGSSHDDATTGKESEGDGGLGRGWQGQDNRSDFMSPRPLSPRSVNLQCIFLRVDASHDGSISRAELIKALRHDPELAELLQLPQHIREGATRDAFARVFEAIDADQSRGITWAEFKQYLDDHRIPTTLEADGPGSPPMPPPPAASPHGISIGSNRDVAESALMPDTEEHARAQINHTTCMSEQIRTSVMAIGRPQASDSVGDSLQLSSAQDVKRPMSSSLRSVEKQEGDCEMSDLSDAQDMSVHREPRPSTQTLRLSLDGDTGNVVESGVLFPTDSGEVVEDAFTIGVLMPHRRPSLLSNTTDDVGLSRPTHVALEQRVEGVERSVGALRASDGNGFTDSTMKPSCAEALGVSVPSSDSVPHHGTAPASSCERCNELQNDVTTLLERIAVMEEEVQQLMSTSQALVQRGDVNLAAAHAREREHERMVTELKAEYERRLAECRTEADARVAFALQQQGGMRGHSHHHKHDRDRDRRGDRDGGGAESADGRMRGGPRGYEEALAAISIEKAEELAFAITQLRNEYERRDEKKSRTFAHVVRRLKRQIHDENKAYVSRVNAENIVLRQRLADALAVIDRNAAALTSSAVALRKAQLEVVPVDIAEFGVDDGNGIDDLNSHGALDSATDSHGGRRGQGQHILHSHYSTSTRTDKDIGADGAGSALRGGDVQELYSRVRVTIARKDAIIEDLKEKYRESQEKVRSLQKR